MCLAFYLGRSFTTLVNLMTRYLMLSVLGLCLMFLKILIMLTRSLVIIESNLSHIVTVWLFDFCRGVFL